MNIFSIKEIVEATNGFLKPNSEKVSKKKNTNKGKKIQIKDTLKFTEKKNINFK